MPLILTLQLNTKMQNFFEQQRRQYFPIKLNKIPAHITVFHQLPEIHFDKIDKKLVAVAQNNVCVPATIAGIKFLGNGNAYLLDFDQNIFLQLRHNWIDWLIQQDKQLWLPHITVQNKVSAQEAKLLNQQLLENFSAQQGLVIGMNLWCYLNGPWKFINFYPFKGVVN